MTGQEPKDQFTPLFLGDRLESWRVGIWSNVGKPAGWKNIPWTLNDGVLQASDTGTWLVSPKEYADFVL